MVGNIGLGKFNPIEMKEAKSSFAPKSLSKKSEVESTPSNDSSASQPKALEKSKNKLENKSEKNSDSNAEQKSESKSYEKSEFSKKVNSLVESQDKSATIDPNKLDKKQIKEFEQELTEKSASTSEIPQMMMLQGVQPIHVNQAAQVPKIAGESSIELNLESKVSAQTQPVLKFMKAMQENFGIQPEQIMKALGQMPPETLMESPNKAMTPLFEKLGLQPKQFTKAQILYTEMLTEMEQVKPELFKGNLAAGATVPALTQLSGKSGELPVQMMEKPIAAPKSTLDQLIEQKISRRALEPQNMQSVSLPKVQQPQVNMAQIFQMDPMANAAVPEDLIAVDKLAEFDPQLRIQDIKVNPNRITENFLSDAPSLSAAGAAIPVLGKEFQKEMSEEEMKDQWADQMAQVTGDKKIDGQFSIDKLAPTTAAGVAVAPGQMSNENVEKLISGSQTLIEKGGGSMKIQLSPDGLGKVHLDIKVQDGQVGVQMMADTQEAKKLLESSMTDLKASLAEHKLNLNHVKVDVSEQASQNMNQSQDFKREEARDFLGQFRQFNESFRQGTNDLSGMRAYKKPVQPSTPDIQPIESRRKDSSDGRLHLVA